MEIIHSGRIVVHSLFVGQYKMYVLTRSVEGKRWIIQQIATLKSAHTVSVTSRLTKYGFGCLREDNRLYMLYVRVSCHAPIKIRK